MVVRYQVEEEDRNRSSSLKERCCSYQPLFDTAALACGTPWLLIQLAAARSPRDSAGLDYRNWILLVLPLP
jgi:hypothetical protein